MFTTKLSTTSTVLATAILLILGVMACPNTPWDSGDPTRELERMHAQTRHDDTQDSVANESLNLLVRQADGNPAPRVAFRLCVPARETQRRRVLYEGVTGADGRCIAAIQLPASRQAFEIEWVAPGIANELGRSGTQDRPHVARTLVQRGELGALELSFAGP